jgi:hypothetical protein
MNTIISIPPNTPLAAAAAAAASAGDLDNLPIDVLAAPKSGDPSLEIVAQVAQRNNTALAATKEIVAQVAQRNNTALAATNIAMPIINWVERCLREGTRLEKLAALVVSLLYPVLGFADLVWSGIVFQSLNDKVPGGLDIPLFRQEQARLRGHLNKLVAIADKHEGLDFQKLHEAMDRVSDFLIEFSKKTTDREQLLEVLKMVKNAVEEGLDPEKQALFQVHGGSVGVLMGEYLLYGYHENGHVQLLADGEDLGIWKQQNHDNLERKGTFYLTVRGAFLDQIIGRLLTQSLPDGVVQDKLRELCEILVHPEGVDLEMKYALDRYREREAEYRAQKAAPVPVTDASGTVLPSATMVADVEASATTALATSGGSREASSGRTARDAGDEYPALPVRSSSSLDDDSDNGTATVVVSLAAASSVSPPAGMPTGGPSTPDEQQLLERGLKQYGDLLSLGKSGAPTVAVTRVGSGAVLPQVQIVLEPMSPAGLEYAEVSRIAAEEQAEEAIKAQLRSVQLLLKELEQMGNAYRAFKEQLELRKSGKKSLVINPNWMKQIKPQMNRYNEQWWAQKNKELDKMLKIQTKDSVLQGLFENCDQLRKENQRLREEMNSLLGEGAYREDLELVEATTRLS